MIGVLTVLAMPVAISLQKTIQSLDYLNFLNVKGLPTNVRSILDLTSEGNLFSGLDPFGDFYKFDDGNDIEEIETQPGASGGRRNIRRIISAGNTVCKTHRILDKEGLSCNGWNNQGLYILQVIGLLILMAILKFLGNRIRNMESRMMKNPANHSRIDKIFEDIN